LVALIVRTEDVNILAGSLTPEGTRTKGALDEYFSPDEISLVLRQSAEKSLNDATNQYLFMRAGALFARSGQYKALLEMFCNQMLDPQVQDEDRRFFYQELRAFYSSYLTRRTHVVDVLERAGALQIRAVCHDLMEVFDYFERIDAGLHQEAWSTLDRLGIIPQTQSDVEAKKERFKGLDPLLKQQVPVILCYAMHSLKCEHTRLKSEGQTIMGNSTMSVLKDLKEKGRIILMFAGLVTASEEDGERIAQMARIEASMI
jgi:Nup93/Nic96